MDKWDFKNESFFDWLLGNPPNPGDTDFVGPPTLNNSLTLYWKDYVKYSVVLVTM